MPGFNSDFYVNVALLMLPRPTRKYARRMLTDSDGSYLPIITVEIGVFE